MSKLNGGLGYANPGLVNDYLTKNKLPRIHDDIEIALAEIPQGERRGILDLGACTGLLCVRAARLGFSPVIGVEADQGASDLFRTLVAPKLGRSDVMVHTSGINVLEPTSLHNLFALTKDWPITTILARRVFPELFSSTFKSGKEETTWRAAGGTFSAAALRAGIKHIVLEGRKWKSYKVHANPLFKLDREIEALGDGWKEVFRYKECAVLEPR